MDTSETYIKMCKEAFPDESPNVFVTHLGDGSYIDKTGSRWVRKGDTFILIKSQDQLQEILLNRNTTSPNTELIGLCGQFYEDFLCSGKTDFVYRATSMEQLWLAFVMKERFGKIWSEDKWIRG